MHSKNVFYYKFNSHYRSCPNWNLRTCGALLDNFILLSFLLFSFIKVHLIIYTVQTSEFNEEVFDFRNFLFTIYSGNASFKYFTELQTISLYLLIYCIYFNVKTLLFSSHNFIPKLMLGMSSLLIFASFRWFCYKSIIIIFSSIWVFSYICYYLQYFYSKKTTKALDLRFYINRALECLSMFGIIMFYISVVIISFQNKIGEKEMSSSISFLATIIPIIAVGFFIPIGKTILSFITYPIEKRYLPYQNEKLNQFILRLNM